jgi:hypothetical protein
VLALIHITHFSDHSEDSCLTESYQLAYTKGSRKCAYHRHDGTVGEPKPIYIPALELVSVETFVYGACVVEEYPGLHESIVMDDSEFSDRFLMVKPRKDWGKYFI